MLVGEASCIFVKLVMFLPGVHRKSLACFKEEWILFYWWPLIFGKYILLILLFIDRVILLLYVLFNPLLVYMFIRIAEN